MNGTLQYVSNSTLKPVEVSNKQTCNTFTFHQVFTFTSIISAVDPVAVLAIFSEVTRSPSFFSPFVDSGRGESGPLLHGLWGVPHQRWSRCGRSTNHILSTKYHILPGSLQNDEQFCWDHVRRGDSHPHQLPHGTS